MSLMEFDRAAVLAFLYKGLSIPILFLLEGDRTTIQRIKKKYQKYRLEANSREKERPEQLLKYITEREAKLIALICGPTPEGQKRWTIRLLVEKLRKQNDFETITSGRVRLMLKKLI